MFKAFGTCLRKYFDFSSRASRSEFWLYILFLVFLAVIIGSAEYCLYYFTTIDEYTLYMVYLIIDVVVAFALIVPTLAVKIRRLHDANKSGWNLLWSILPSIALIVSAVLYVVFALGGSIPTSLSGFLVSASIWYVLWLIVPAVGKLILFIFYCKKSYPYANKWGEPAGKVYGAATESTAMPTVDTNSARRQPWKD